MADPKDILGWEPKEPYKEKGKKTSKKVEVDYKKFEVLLYKTGVRVKVYRTLFCPNVKSIDGSEHNIDCDKCNGSGFLDIRPIETISYIQHQKLTNVPFSEGMTDGNTVMATFLLGVELQYFTLVELLDFTEIFFERIQRQETGPDVLKYKACKVNIVVDSESVEYFQGVDYTLDINGSIVWKIGKGPSIGSIYSIHYEAAVQFRAIQALHSNRFTKVAENGVVKHIKLHEQWMLSKEFLVKRKNSLDGTELESNDITELE